MDTRNRLMVSMCSPGTQLDYKIRRINQKYKNTVENVPIVNYPICKDNIGGVRNSTYQTQAPTFIGGLWTFEDYCLPYTTPIKRYVISNTPNPQRIYIA